MIDVAIDIEPKEEYKPVYTQTARYKDLWGGRGRGGSHEATLYALYRLTSPTYCRCAFVRKIYNDVRTSLWQDFKDRIEECGAPGFRLNDTALSGYSTLTGNQVKCFGVKADKGRTAKLKSLAGYNLIIIEEFDELNEDEANTIDDTLRTVKGNEPEIVRIFNPPGRLHWIWKKHYNLIEAKLMNRQGEPVEGYWKAEPRTGQNLLSVFGDYTQNIQNLAPTTIANFEGYEKSKPEYYYTMIKGLISEGQRGRVYKGWRPITDQQFEDLEAQSYWALDFGWSASPMALAEIKLSKNRVYGREHIYQPMTLKQVAIEMCKLGLTKRDKLIADSEDRLSINRLRTGWKLGDEGVTQKELELYPQLGKGFFVLGALKPPGSINHGISLCQDREIFITEGSVNWWAEYQNYRWALDANKNPTNTPEDDYNHLMDDLRYIVSGKGKIF